MTPRRPRGQAVVELALLIPALLITFLLVAALGIVARANGGVLAVADEAARAAALASDSTSAVDAARQRAGAVAQGYGLTNGSLQVAVDTRDFQRGGDVRVQVAYSLPLDQLPLLGWARVPIQHQGSEPIAPNRSFR